MGRPRVHFDETYRGHEARRGACGWVYVDTTHDLTQVTCQMCLARVRERAQRPVERPKSARAAVGKAEMRGALAQAFSATLAPSAGPPPRLTPPMWAASCRGGEHRRCGSCELCAWEREASRWHAVSPWNRTHRADTPRGCPTWTSLAAALVALADWEAHNRWSPSAMGGILARIASGETGGAKDAKGEDPLLGRAGDLVMVRLALERAYPDGAHASLTQAQCMRVLMSRTPGVLAALPTYDALAEQHGVTIGDLRALVRSGRRHVTVVLAARGMIPMPPAKFGLAEAVEMMRKELVYG